MATKQPLKPVTDPLKLMKSPWKAAGKIPPGERAAAAAADARSNANEFSRVAHEAPADASASRGK